TSCGRSEGVALSADANCVSVFALPMASLSRQPKFAVPLLISASTSTVTATLRVAGAVVPVVNVAVVLPYASVCAPFQVVVPFQVVRTGVTLIVRLEFAASVTRRLRVAESAPPVVGMPQLERSKRMNVQVWLLFFGLTLRTVPPPKLDVGFLSSTYVSVVEV